MSDGVSKRTSKLKPVATKVSPKPNRDDVAQHLLDEYSAKLADPDLSAIDRAEAQKAVEAARRYLKRIRETN